MRLPLPRFTRRRLLAPEVVQTSAMDCGPAALKCLLEGFGLPVSYGRLREACQTDVDGTSIDVLEDTAVRLGLAAEQIMIPADHLLLPEARALPALLVAVRPGGVTHFIVVWRRIGPLVQVMDPAIGRRWMTERELLDEVYVHRLNVPADDWAAWARSEDFCRPLERRLRRLGGGRTRAAAWVRQAATDPTAERLAALDAAARLVAALIDSGGATRGRAAARLVQTLAEAARDCDGKASVIPEALWTVRPAEAVDDRPQRALRGIVLLRVRGRQPRPVAEGEPSAAAALSRELRAAVAERPVRVAREVFRLLGPGAWRSAAALGGGMFLSAAGLVCEALLLRGAMEAARDLHLVEQRLGAVAMFLLFVLALLLVELQVVRGVLRWGRELEVRLRMAFLRKLPRLNDRYFRSRPASDMAERSHTSHQVRHLPWLGGELLRHALTLLLTTAAIGLLYPDLAAAAWVSAALMVGLPLAFSRRLEEQDLRVRTHTGALSRFDFDALLGLWPVRAHAAEPVLRREHEGLLVEWARASLRLVRTTAVVDAAVTGIGFALAGWLVLRHVQSAPEPAGALLLAYWALQLPVLGSEFALLVAQRPFYRNSFLRLMEPLGAPEESPAAVERTVEATRGAARRP
jgi:ATP-binding cassette subfamily B protein